MKAKELQELTVDELMHKEKELREKYFNLKFQLSTNQIASTADVTKVRKDIARVKTILVEKNAE